MIRNRLRRLPANPLRALGAVTRSLALLLIFWAQLWAAVPALAAPDNKGLAGSTLIVLDSPSTRHYFDGNPAQYDAMLAQWRNFAAHNQLVLKMLASDQLNTLRPGAVLVLPALVALSERERSDLEAAGQRGVNFLATWSFAPRDAQGNWLGYGFMKKIFDAEVVAEVKPDGLERFLQWNAETPLTAGLAPLKRVFLAKSQEPLLKALAPHSVARYSDWARSVTKENVNQAAVTYNELGQSRRVWLGMPETSWPSALDDIDSLLISSLNWLLHKPAAVLGNWPAPYQSAFLLEMDTEAKFQNALSFEQELSKRGMRGTFYCLTDEAVKYPEVVRQLAQHHEIAYHADVHIGFKGQDPAIQKARMQRMIAAMTPLISDIRQASGFRAPLEDFDTNTEIIMRSVGLRHHATTPDYADVALPGFSKAEPTLGSDEALVLLPRTMLDDVNLQRMGMLEKSVAGVLINTAKTIIDAHAFGMLSIHTQNYGEDSALYRDIPHLLDVLAERKDRVWVASGDQLERWWREKQHVSLQTTQAGRQLDLKLHVTGQARNIQVIVMAPSLDSVPTVQSAQPATLQKLDSQRWALVFADLKAGVHQIKVSF